ncbi:response regulator transcription factor [Streptantibioticus parmotrematis]|uniref:response regulator transcription factor n=1 Tax=Streptantibioticus parmotrematis TaxID=2873249 RepID=UPI00340164CF
MIREFVQDVSAKSATLAVAVLANDPVTAEGAVSWLSACQELTAVHWTHRQSADVLAVFATEVTGDTLTRVERVQRDQQGCPLPVVMVANELPEHHLLRAIDLGLVSFLYRQDSGFDEIRRAVAEAAEGPEPGRRFQQALIHQIKTVRDSVLLPHGINVAGLSPREIKVLRLLADGWSTRHIAARLSYSERTVKSIVHNVVTRLNLRNRTHAVVYALRAGVL